MSMLKVGMCPKCGETAEMYPEDADHSVWTISCNSKYWDCNFEISSTDPALLPKLWEYACEVLDSE